MSTIDPDSGPALTRLDALHPGQAARYRLLVFITEAGLDRLVEAARLLDPPLRAGRIGSWALDRAYPVRPLGDYAAPGFRAPVLPIGGWVDELGLLHRVAWPSDGRTPAYLRGALTGVHGDLEFTPDLTVAAAWVHAPEADPISPTAWCRRCAHPGADHAPRTLACQRTARTGVLCGCLAFGHHPAAPSR